MSSELKAIIIGLFRQGASEKEMKEQIGLPIEDIYTVVNIYFLTHNKPLCQQ